MSIKNVALAAFAAFVIAAIGFGLHTPSVAKCDVCGTEKEVSQMVQLSGNNSIVFRCHECI